MESGKELFLRYSHGCRMYCEEKGMISADDLAELDRGNPSYEVLRRVFYVAIPSLENIAERMSKELDRKMGVFDLDVLREFYSGEHNERKMGEGQLVCLSFPAKVVEVDDSKENNYRVELEPVKGGFWAESHLNLNVGDWVVMHRADIVEKIPGDFAVDMKARLAKLGLDKTYKFPKVAIKYLKQLRKSSENKIGRSHGNEQADEGAPDEGKGEAQVYQGGPQGAPDQGPGEADA
jgi:hydrogenase maturation factor